jgi:serine/threonine protein kinase
MTGDAPERLEHFQAASRLATIGRYTLGPTVGFGASSLVRIATDPSQSTLYACKIVPRQCLNTSSLRTRFEEEVHILRRLDHPGIVHLLDVMQDSEHYFLFMEYCSHGELFNFVHDHGRLKEVQARFIIREVLEALHYIHSQGIAHRDIKLENIFISEQCHVKIGDFGLGKNVGDDGFCATSCGSPYYASPECLSGSLYNAKKSDIWSCGIALYWLLTGGPPWTGRNHFQLFEQIKKGDYKIPEGLNENCEDFLKKLLTVDPGRRLMIEEAFEHPWLKAGPKAKFPDEGPLPYVGLRHADSIFEESMTSIELASEKELRLSSVRASSIAQIERLIVGGRPSQVMPVVGMPSGARSVIVPVRRRLQTKIGWGTVVTPGQRPMPGRSASTRKGLRPTVLGLPVPNPKRNIC